MDRNSLLFGMTGFGACAEEIFSSTFGTGAENINENVIVSPGWPPERLFDRENITQIVGASPLFEYKVWDIRCGSGSVSYVNTGFGAPVVTDALLLLGLTGCRKILFVSSVGALSAEIKIWDIVIPEYSASGDGASRFLSEDMKRDIFGEKNYPNAEMSELLVNETARLCNEKNAGWHMGRTFCTDTIVGQYGHLESIIKMGYNSIDMESAAAFRTAKIMGISIAALLLVSDNSAARKSLMTSAASRIGSEEQEYRQFVRGEIMPQIIRAAFFK
ncbi:MAG: phosphorylase [Oscillospiraceae bacterium]|nr:phosphorylase [Oscillospiraceae bacterium]